ncbi:hypothetical protein Tco_0989514, partial [Tanacetum coccineum]
VASDDLRDALSVIFGLSELKAPPSPDYVPGPGSHSRHPKPSPRLCSRGPEHADDRSLLSDQPYAWDASQPLHSHLIMVPRVLILRGTDDMGHRRQMRRMRMNEMGCETKPFETDESAATPPPYPAYRMTARITILELVHVPVWSAFEAAATSHSLPLPPPFILSPTRPDAPPPMPTSAPTSLPPLLLPSASHREDRPEVNLPPRERLRVSSCPRYEVERELRRAWMLLEPAGVFIGADYGFVAHYEQGRSGVTQEDIWIWDHGIRGIDIC